MEARTTSRRAQRDAKPRQGDRREQAILEATAELLATTPFAELKIEQIAAAAGVSRSSVYFYFSDKVEILVLLYGRVFEEMSAELERWFADPDKHSEQWSRTTIAAAVTIARRNSGVVRSALDNRWTNAEIDAVWARYFDHAVEVAASLIEREREAGLAPSTGPAAGPMARALMHMTMESLHELLRSGGGDRQAAELIDTLTVLWARGTGTDPA
jgi:TetR/AcrR family transcriptional regulator, ethionamide resistance regulator